MFKPSYVQRVAPLEPWLGGVSLDLSKDTVIRFFEGRDKAMNDTVVNTLCKLDSEFVGVKLKYFRMTRQEGTALHLPVAACVVL